MVLQLRVAELLVLLWSATLLAQFASAQTNLSAESRVNRYSAQIAHHTELPYIREPHEQSNDVDPHADSDGPVTTLSSINHSALNTTEATPISELNNEDNNVAAIDGPDFGVSGRIIPITPQPQVPWFADTRMYSSQLPSEHLHFPPSYGMSHPLYGQTSRPDYGVRTFKCTFEEHICGMRNQKNIGPNFKLVADRIYNRKGHYMAVDAAHVGHGVSRLITPYLPGRPNVNACLQLTYIVAGPGAERIQIVAQDVGNRPLFSLENHGPFWRTFGINMTVNQDVRFFIEAYTNRNHGVVAIDDFTYSFDPCLPRFHR